jgi:hypothetical protein
VAGAAAETLLLASAESKYALVWSPDGRFMLSRNLGPKTGPDLWALPIDLAEAGPAETA